MTQPVAPILDVDVFTDENLANSEQVLKHMRDAGEAVWIPKLNVYAIARYEGVKKALGADSILINSKGVAINENLNKMSEMTPVPMSSLLTDGMDHRKSKKQLMAPMRPNAIESLKQRLKEQSDYIVGQVANDTEFDAMDKLCTHLPHHLIADMLGIEGIDTAVVNKWATAAFDAWGPAELPRSQAGFKDFAGMPAYMKSVDPNKVRKDSWADLMFQAGENGKLPMDLCRNLVFDYVVPSMDTTIHATAEMLYQLATTAGAYDAVRDNRDLVKSAVWEAVRLSTPIRGHTRYAAEDYEMDTVTIPKGSRVWVMFASANRDERHYEDPDTFKVDRNPVDHMGWGHGAHACLGKHLSIAEMEAMLNALCDKVQRIELAGEPERLINNQAQGYQTLPIRLHT